MIGIYWTAAIASMALACVATMLVAQFRLPWRAAVAGVVACAFVLFAIARNSPAAAQAWHTHLDTVVWVLFVAALSLSCIATLLVAAGRVRGRNAAWLIIGCAATLLLAGRWQTVFIMSWLNVDESLMLAQAMKFTTDLMPWRAIDPGTGGPINSYALLPLHWLGMDLGYPLARITTILCLTGYLALLFLAMRRLAGTAVAAIALLPATVVHAVATSGDGTHYSSEIASLLSIALLVFVASRLASPLGMRAEIAWAFATGVCAFLVTMSKLQGVLLGATLSISIVALASPTLIAFVRRVAGIIAGGAVAASVLVALLVATGVWDDFRISFLELPQTYVGTPLTFAATVALVQTAWEMRLFVEVLAWLAGGSLLLAPFWLRAERPSRWLLRAMSFALVLGAAYLTISQPGREFPHYLTYLPIAGAWLWLMLLPWESDPPLVRHGASDAP
jgi:hypothetical protein